MKEYDNTNKGMLGKNLDRKTDKHPEYRGSINVGGVEYWLSAWVKVAGPTAKEPGSKFFSLAITPKDGLPETRPAPKQQQPVTETFTDDDIGDIPF